MISKDEFKFYVQASINFNNFSNKLYDLNVDLLANDEVEEFCTSYFEMLCRLMDLPEDDDEASKFINYHPIDKIRESLSDLVWNCTDNVTDEEIDRVYNQVKQDLAIEKMMRPYPLRYDVDDDEEKKDNIDISVLALNSYKDLFNTVIDALIRKVEED